MKNFQENNPVELWKEAFLKNSFNTVDHTKSIFLFKSLLFSQPPVNFGQLLSGQIIYFSNS